MRAHSARVGDGRSRNVAVALHTSVARALLFAGATIACAPADVDALDATGESRTACASGLVVEGIQVSSANGEIDWMQARDQGGKVFAYARIADGLDADPAFSMNWQRLGAAGILRGGYLVYRPDQDTTAQAAVVGRAVGTLQPGDLPVAVLVQDTGFRDRETYHRGLRDLLHAIEERSGRQPIIRTNRNLWQAVNSAGFTGYPLWQAEHTTAPCPTGVPAQWTSWSFWTYRGPPAADLPGGVCPGVPTYVDLVRYDGGRTQLEGYAGLNDSCEADCAQKGCSCVDGICSGGLCPGSGCTREQVAACSAAGAQCVDGACSGGRAPGSGCTIRETIDCAAQGGLCVDHACSGNLLPGTGCTAGETASCARVAAGCADHECSGGFGAGDGCTPYERALCAGQGAVCIDHECEGGLLPGHGCTLRDGASCAVFGCGCVDRQCSGGACPGSGCTQFETAQCALTGLGCANHACTGD